MLVHRRFDFDGRAVAEPGVVPTGTLEFKPTFLGHPLLDDRAEVVGSLRAVHADHAHRAPLYILLRRPRLELDERRDGPRGRGPVGPRRP